MYCPQCSQIQATESVKFCPRCGFPLDFVAAMVANGGILPPQVLATKTRKSLRRKRMRQGAKLIFLSFVLFPIFGLISGLANSPGPLFVPFAFFITGIAWVTYVKLFWDADYEEHAGPIFQPAQPKGQFALPSPQAIPAADYLHPRARTAEIVQPPSVTENTTRLLDGDEPVSHQ
jgi:hypothetical protein